MDYTQIDIKEFSDKYLQKHFIILYIIILLILCFVLSFIQFLGKWPILLIITFFVAVYLKDRYRLGV